MKKTARGDGNGASDLERLIAEVTAGVQGDDEQLRAFHQALRDGIDLPGAAFVLGEPVQVLSFDYDGNPRLGLMARCRREDGAEHRLAASGVTLAPQSGGGHLLAAYHRWLGLDPAGEQVAVATRRKRQHKVATADLDLSQPVELVVLSVKDRAARCRLPGTDRVITLRATGLWDIVPGEIAVVRPRKQWSYAGHPYLSGEIESARLDVAALGLVPLKLEEQGVWEPDEHYWGEEDDPIEEWA